MDKWRKLVEAKFPGDRLSVYNLFGIGSAEVLVEALKRAGNDITREKMVAALANLKDFKTEVYAGSDHLQRRPTIAATRAPAWMAKEPGGPIKVLGYHRTSENKPCCFSAICC